MPQPYRLHPKVGTLSAYSRSNGFALAIALSLMAFVLLLLLSITTLVHVEQQSAETSKHKLESKQAALLSLNLAIGSLQETAGLDQRVTAPAQSVAGIPDAERSKKLTGVWRAWEGLDHDKTTGLPEAPVYDLKLDNGKLDIGSADQGRFLSWLTSSFQESKNSGTALTVTDVPPVAESAGTVQLLAKGTLGSTAVANDEVHIRPTEMPDGSGAYAWWVQGENIKVRLKVAEDPGSSKLSVSEQMLVSPAPSGIDFNIDDTTGVDRAGSLESLDLLVSSAPLSSDLPSEFFHDLTIYSKGLLTNTSNGGWRRDLSLLSESWASIDEGFSSFTLSPGKVVLSGKSSSSASSSAHPVIYPWTNWDETITANQNSSNWAALADFATQYKQLTSSGNEIAEIFEATNRQHATWSDTVQRMPVIARVHYVFSLSSRLDGTDYLPCIVVNPVFTLWNPYNVALDMGSGNYTVELRQISPFNFTFEAGTDTRTTNLGTIVASRSTSSFKATIPVASPSLWLPGEVRVYSASGEAVVDRNRSSASSNIPTSAGYRPGSGLRYPVHGMTAQAGDTPFSVTAATVTDGFKGGSAGVQGLGLYFTVVRNGAPGSNATNNIQSLLTDPIAVDSSLGTELVLPVSATLSTLSALEGSPLPFSTVVMGLRYGRDINPDDPAQPASQNILVNGIHHANPVVGYMSEATGSVLGGRLDSFTYDLQYFAVNSTADPGMPSGLEDEMEGYIGSGLGSGDGLSNMIALEIPTRPLRSIGDLQHFNVNAPNRFGPYTLNALGNSRASPFIKSDKVQVDWLDGTTSDTVGHDHSYAMNHLFFDDWFVSTISNQPDDWSASGGSSFDDVYLKHLSGDELLSNHYYKPSAAATDGTSAFDVNDDDAWQKVAAELEVEGMFNINSSSERAWAMLLKRHFNSGDGAVLALEDTARAPISGDVSPSVVLEDDTGSPFSRSILVSDQNAAGLGGGDLLSRYTRFSESQINALAREIVAEIEKRGPFLSLSEFFNRQLLENADATAADSELARAGAVETALLRLATLADEENPYADLQDDFSDTASTYDMVDDPLTWPFEAAAEGNPAYGFPGWTRQADVLRSVSGILSARDDTFTIRAYGDVRNPATNEVVSQSWCEAVVQRKAEYIDNSIATGDKKYTLPSESTLNSEVNKRFGRRFEIIHFRWLDADEV
ncbi:MULTISPECIES: hypothetical protein [unclassified Lentimonas]|uniref:hypothetical protein n=1 Tax=unclassified Lentimonas TaxID=2630993 RepID=UPI00132553D9|nr:MULTISPECIES: hypothetical protein [unclassified Lentimonas]CAA6677612.1 Unannotated [Lentimonas sp. CC4]CAA6684290.1 Unannotated [Lentimonas sp. CC6]CAA7078194.1 Unannotated [Lentimonas sp. CC4]CAA7168290.1 Unannotated [Lentimonas sp. CC21]CAA7181876.1 Unannotated [Lentimonas sp. CC8]